MPFPQARIGDMSMGHWVSIFYFPPTPLITGSPTAFSCCLPACRVTDMAAKHFAWILGIVPLPAFFHDPVAITGSPTCLINFLPAFRVMDLYNCGDIQAVGCPLNMVGP